MGSLFYELARLKVHPKTHLSPNRYQYFGRLVPFPQLWILVG
jgi:hypothetical protein